jgi:hypothetical protein
MYTRPQSGTTFWDTENNEAKPGNEYPEQTKYIDSLECRVNTDEQNEHINDCRYMKA